MIRSGLALGATFFGVAACGGAQAGLPPGSGPLESPHVTTTGGPVMSGTGLTGPPPFRLRYDGQELVLRPHTWCYDSGCVDGASADSPSVGSPTAIRVRVPVEDWDLVATFTPVGQRCGRQQTVKPTEVYGWHLLDPAGRSGLYNVDLFAQGGGDMVARFRWATPTDGAPPIPKATLALIAEHDGAADSYGVELTLENLADTPHSVRARITVAAANGRSLTFDARQAEGPCSPEGTVYFDGPDAKGRAAAALGDLPFHYTVVVMIDGTTYRSSADYPADEIRGNEPSVALEFTPALPALR